MALESILREVARAKKIDKAHSLHAPILTGLSDVLHNLEDLFEPTPDLGPRWNRGIAYARMCLIAQLRLQIQSNFVSGENRIPLRRTLDMEIDFPLQNRRAKTEPEGWFMADKSVHRVLR